RAARARAPPADEARGAAMHPLVRRAKAIRKSVRERRELAPAKVAIVSFPKSGRTWLRLLIGRALCQRHGLPESGILDTFALTRAAGILPTVFTHDGTSNTEGRHLEKLGRDKRAYRDKRVLLLCRDPRDTAISCFFEATRRKQVYRGTLSEFLRDPHYGMEKIVRFYEFWDAARGVPERICPGAIECGRFDNMRKRERAGGRGEGPRLRPGDARDTSSFKTRQG